VTGVQTCALPISSIAVVFANIFAMVIIVSPESRHDTTGDIKKPGSCKLDIPAAPVATSSQKRATGFTLSPHLNSVFYFATGT